MADSSGITPGSGRTGAGTRAYLYYLIVVLVASAVYVGTIISPPSLMDDVDAVQAQIARNMITSGDWVTAHIDRVVYLEKPPLLYWLMAISYKIFGVHDWAARVPVALSTVALCWLVAAFGMWAFGKRAGLYAGLCLATCVGLFLFTRILIPDVMLTFTIALAMWAFLRAIDDEEPHPLFWSILLAASLGVGLLLKSLIGVVFPVGAALLYLLFTHQLFSAKVWRRLHPFLGAGIILAIAAPWHILATLRNPPTFAFTLHSGPNDYHGFLWFFFINEQLLRFLNRRYPRDYNTVPRLWFWLLNLVWLFPWSVYLPTAAKLSYKPVDRAGRTRLLALCWIGFVMVFFTFSTTQEYYSMPIYPALALLLGSAMVMMNDSWIRRGSRVLAVIAGGAALATIVILFLVRHVATPGDISTALGHHPKAYSLSLGHIEDLTLDSFAYLRVPLIVAGVGFLIGCVGAIRGSSQRAFWAAALMMVLLLHAARGAMVVFNPYLSSRPLANVLLKAPPGKLIAQGHYYGFSSVFFYTDRTGLLYSDREVNLAYGEGAPGAPKMFISTAQLKALWSAPDRYYLLAPETALPTYQRIVGADQLTVVASSGKKLLLTNHPLSPSVARLCRPRAPAGWNAILRYSL